MAELVTIARPYAEAAFSVAQAESASTPKAFEAWSEFLQKLAAISEDKQIRVLFGNPAVSPEQIAKLMVETSGASNESMKNFIGLLSSNQRLEALSCVSGLYEDLKNQANSTLSATVETAFKLSTAELSEIQALLEKKYGRSVKATPVLNEALIGGVRISVGDEVIDASVSGKLSTMATALMN
jgi:F-type H+-transporting ATPase subunit delta